jgi:hypothetical protein
MSFFRFCWTLFLILITLFPFPAIGQLAPNTTPGFEQYLRQWGYTTPHFPTPEARPQIEGPLPLPHVRPLHEHTAGPQVDKEKRLSYWGYRHPEVHANGLVAKLQDLTGKSCCDGPKSGECRISVVDLPAKKVLVDGEWCPYFDTTKVVVLDGLEKLQDGQETIALVCAARTNRILGLERRQCAGVYCIGILPVKM